MFLHDDYRHVYGYLPPFRRLGSHIGYVDILYCVCMRNSFNDILGMILHEYTQILILLLSLNYLTPLCITIQDMFTKFYTNSSIEMHYYV